MFIVEALADFSSQTIKANQDIKKQYAQQSQNNGQKQALQGQQNSEQEIKSKKRQRTKEQAFQLEKQAQQRLQQQHEQIKYLSFKTGQKLLVKQTYQNGWWYGHLIRKPQQNGFFPSNYVKVGAKPPAPPPNKQKKTQKQEQAPQFDPNEGTDWIKKQLDRFQTGPVKSDYYQGIKGYKMVKIDDKNQNILKGNHVQFDVATGLARVPVKDQAPTAKAVRQMGYYFDYHQWNESMNHNPQKKARPDPKKKKAKKLNLKLMD